MGSKIRAIFLIGIILAGMLGGFLATPRVARAASNPIQVSAQFQFLFPVIAGIGAGLLGLGTAWVAKKVKCVTDVDCLVRNMTLSILNNSSLILIGSSATELGGEDLLSMMKGEGRGLAYTLSGVIDGGLENPLDLNLAGYFKSEFSDNLLKDFSPPAQAQGIAETTGGKILVPIQDIWRAVRDAAYGLFVVVMLAIGFMIIFRSQLPSRTVVTFTYALPRILLGLVLITFSYPLIALAFNVVVPFGGSVIKGLLPDTVLLEEPTAEAKGGIAGATLDADSSKLVGEASASMLEPFLAKIKEARDSGDEEGAASEALQALISFSVYVALIVITLLIVVAQVIYRLAKLLVYTIFSPFIILFGTLPGQEGGLSKFAKGLFATLLAFPAMVFMFNVTRLILLQSLTIERTGVAGLGPGVGSALTINALALVFLILTAMAPSLIGGFIEGGPRKK